MFLRGGEGSHPCWRKETRRRSAEGGAAVAQECDTHGHTRQGPGIVFAHMLEHSTSQFHTHPRRMGTGRCSAVGG